MRRIEFELDRRGMSQTALAEETGINRVIINGLINGRETPFPKWREAIAKALDWDKDPARLFEEVDLND